MRIVSWNVNGLLTTLKDATHRFSNASIYFTTVLHADIVCFQEAKIQEEKLEKWMACVPGFESFWAFSKAKKGYSGVVTYVKDEFSPVDAAADKLPDAESDVKDLCEEGRIVETDHGSFVLINVYVPNAGDRGEGRPRLDFKIRFLQSLKKKCDEIVSAGRHVVVVGDFNIAHKSIDLHKKWNIEEIYSPEETQWLDAFLTDYQDLYRHFHPDVTDVFSVWEAKTEARIHNEGLRIDYAVCDKGFLSQVKDTQILKMVPKNWSDHAAVVLTLQEQPGLPPHPPSSLSSHNMKQFQEDRRQKKLTSLFNRGSSKPTAVPKGASATPARPVTPENSVARSCSDAEKPSSPDQNVGQSTEGQQQPSSPPQDVPDEVQSDSGVTIGDHLVANGGQAAGSIGQVENQGQGGLASEGVLKEPISQLEKGHVPVQAQSGAGKSDGSDSTANLANGDVESNLSSRSDRVAETNAEEGSTLKRKDPPEPSSEAGLTAGKQRNLNSYFSVASRNNGGGDDVGQRK